MKWKGSWSVCENRPEVTRQTYKEHAEGETDVFGLLEGAPLDDAAGPPRREAGLHEAICDDEGADLDEANGANGPAETDRGQQLAGHGGEDEAARDGAGGRDANGEGALLFKVGRDDGDGRAEEAAVAQAHADALAEDKVPVLRADRRGEDAQGDQDGAQEQNRPKEAGVGDSAGEGSGEKGQENLYRADP